MSRIPSKSSITYNIKKPTGKRRSFAVHIRERHKDGSSKYTPLKNERIESINRSFKNGIISEESALDQIKKIAKNILADAYDRKFTSDDVLAENANLLKSYWKKEYDYRDLVDRSSAMNDLKRSLAAVGKISLISGSREELQRAINEFSPNAKAQRRIVGCVNQLLKFVGRDFKLTRRKKTFTPPKYLNIDEFKQLLKHIENPLCAFRQSTGGV